MIVYEIVSEEDPAVASARRAVLEAFTPMHLIHGYSSIEGLSAFLDAGLEDMRKAQIGDQIPKEMPIALTRCWLFYSDRDALAVCGVRMAPGVRCEAWAQPGGWTEFYKQIESLRMMARRYDPAFTPMHP